jgi:hypothetical protein
VNECWRISKYGIRNNGMLGQYGAGMPPSGKPRRLMVGLTTVPLPGPQPSCCLYAMLSIKTRSASCRFFIGRDTPHMCMKWEKPSYRLAVVMRETERIVSLYFLMWLCIYMCEHLIAHNYTYTIFCENIEVIYC